MPRVNLPHTQISRAGIAPGSEVTGDPSNNHSTANDGKVFLLARNSGSGSARTVTLKIPTVVDGQAVASRTVSVPISSSKYIGPFPPGDYGNVLEVDVDHAELKLTAYHL
jgi:archaellum component FlaG (FlaF/FlaG flagellin family)